MGEESPTPTPTPSRARSPRGSGGPGHGRRQLSALSSSQLGRPLLGGGGCNKDFRGIVGSVGAPRP